MKNPETFMDDPDYRPNVGMMLVNHRHQILAGEAIHYPGQWMMPQGGIDKDETPHQAMQRELVEETSIFYNDVRFIAENPDWLSYLFREPLVKDGQLYKGQRQKWFLLEYNGDLPDAETTIDREFIRFDWVDVNWLIRHTTPFKVDVYKTVYSVFEECFP